MGEQELFTLIVAITIVTIVGRTVAKRFDIPEAIVLVVLGVLASLIPQVPNIELAPNLVLLVFLPPLLYNAAFFSSPRENRENAVPISALAIGTTALTIVAVAWVTRLILPELPLAAAALAFAAAMARTCATRGGSGSSSAGAAFAARSPWRSR